MLKNASLLLVLLAICLCSQSFFFDDKEIAGAPASVEANYQNFCGGCHGEKMDAFVDRQWKHGNSLQEMIYGIKIGYPIEGMPGFDSAFNDQEIKELAEYILTGIENVKKYNFKETPKSNVFKSESLTIKLDTVATGLAVPWGMAFLPNGDLLVTERSGKLFRIGKNRDKQEIMGVPEVVAEGQGGLMDIALHPNFKQNKLVYISYSLGKTVDGAKLATTAVTRAILKDNTLTNPALIFEALPYSRTRHHYGSRMVFDKMGDLFITVGERGNEKENPQDLARGLGKIHRINDDGTIPADNPYKDHTGKVTSVYSYGHRNPQGMAVHPTTGIIWENEHGPRGGDEINLIAKANNYGWPLTSFGINYNGKIITDKSTAPGITDPLLYWLPSIGPSGMAFITGDRYKPWKGHLLVGSLRFKYLNLCYLKNGKVVKQEILLKNIGRVRDVRMGPDGYIYVAVEHPAAAIFRLKPVLK
jgi:glucose/arabinose dehydrogenase